MMVFYWISSIGFCLVVKHGSILESFREKTSELFPFLKKLYKCCLCMGFWVGMSMIPFLYVIEGFGIELVWYPFSTSALCWIADSVLSLIHSLTILVDKKIDEE
jgi:hypothetical protein